MARRKKAPKRRRSSRRLGAIGKILPTGALYQVAGAVAGKVLTNVVGKQLGNTGLPETAKKWLTAATPIIGGIVTGMISKGQMAKDLAAGMYVIGGVQLVSESGAIGALDDVDYNRNFVALAPTNQNPRGVVAGIGELSLEKAAVLS